MIFNIGDLSNGIRPVYDNGDKKIGFTGGWGKFAPSYDGVTGWIPKGETTAQTSTNPVGGIDNGDSLEIFDKTPTSSAWANCAWVTANSLNLTSYTKLHIQATTAESAGNVSHYHVFGVTSSKSPTGGNSAPGTYATINANGETVLDISGISAGYIYFGASTRNNSTNATAHVIVKKIWLT